MSQSNLTLQQLAPGEWAFVKSRKLEKADTRFAKILNLLDDELTEEITVKLAKFLRKYPEYLDAYYYLAMMKIYNEDYDGGLSLLKKAVSVGEAVYPAEFIGDNKQLHWKFSGNRPFLRICEAFASLLRDMGKDKEALKQFEKLLNLNPADNQGIRGSLIDLYFENAAPNQVLKLVDRYPEDILPEINYGKVLAMLQLGKNKKAAAALKKAHAHLPLVAREIAKKKHRKPESDIEGYVTVGGADQAYEYWQNSKAFWKETPGAIDFVRQWITHN